ncbi:MAG: 1-deoxy-D-xylulose-5-phosphate reductoisomerase [Candidatus Omnitrophica bacterium]|nr:1-deoxy-D-xylulose-5-phosphate reductoisomerase [Candidatus Omnitrophota bacterium]MDD5487588.1 1-deoxy-D-xylulose-5-phosphate reductoisomerase [Candidatus Omnitrophota bacterium]
MKDIVIFGSTGSVGRNVLDIIRSFPEKFRVKALVSRSNSDLLVAQALEFRPDIVAIYDESGLTGLKNALEGIKITGGAEALEDIAGAVKADIVFMCISGTAALKPLIAALKAGRKVALASKEPVVSAGMILRDTVKGTSAEIVPVDSEHSAIMQCLYGRDKAHVKRLFVTGTGGSLSGRSGENLDNMSVSDVLAHPKWSMGRKITVDSATLMNKGLEVIEARWLFDIPQDRIKVVIHPEAIIHSMVEFLDGTMAASLFSPDMRFPILTALSFPDMFENSLPRLDPVSVGKLTFTEPDTARFPALALAYEALDAGGTMPAVLNASNESAVHMFLDGKIKFTRIPELVEKVMEQHKNIKVPSLDDVISAEAWAREEVLRFC